MTYVALLRGINVGGHGKVDMKSLKAVFEACGMTSVRTYINSGNVVFSSDLTHSRLSSLLEKAIEEHFGHAVSVLVRDADEIRSVVEALPAEWTNDDTMRCNVIFLWNDIDDPSIVDQLSWNPDVEDVMYTPGAVIWGMHRSNASRSRMTKIIGTPLYKRMTIRNSNTARKLLELVGEVAAKPDRHEGSGS